MLDGRFLLHYVRLLRQSTRQIYTKGKAAFNSPENVVKKLQQLFVEHWQTQVWSHLESGSQRKNGTGDFVETHAPQSLAAGKIERDLIKKAPLCGAFLIHINC